MTQARSNVFELLWITTKEDHEKEATTSCKTTAATKKISVDAAVAAVFSKVYKAHSIFTLKQEEKKNGAVSFSWWMTCFRFSPD